MGQRIRTAPRGLGSCLEQDSCGCRWRGRYMSGRHTSYEPSASPRNGSNVLLRHPGLLHDVEEALGTIDLAAPLARLRNELVLWAEHAQALDSGALLTHLTSAGLAA